MDINKLTNIKIYEAILKDKKIVAHNAYQNENGTIYLPYKNKMTYVIPKAFQNAIFSYYKNSWFNLKGFCHTDQSYFTTNIQFALKILAIFREINFYHYKTLLPSLSVIDCTKFMCNTNLWSLSLHLGAGYETSANLIVNREEGLEIKRFYNSNDNKEKLSNIKSSQELLNFFLSNFKFKKSISIKLNAITRGLRLGAYGRNRNYLRLVKKSIYDL